MCLTIPGKIIAVDGNYATVDYGRDGTRTNINISMVPVRVGSYVLVQAGVAIRVLGEEEAQEALHAWKIIEEELET